MLKKSLKYSAVPVALASTFTLPTYAEESSGLEEVVVTAQKREQNLQDVPVAITAINAEGIEDRKISDISDIGSTAPNVQIAPSPGGSTGASISIRGASAVNPAATWEPTVGLYLDGVFISKNVGGIFDVAALQGIEILRGPQGTLYGKNTAGGAVNLVTRKPYEEFGGEVKVGVGNYGYTEFGGTIDSGKLGEIASMMFSYKKRDREGFYDNTALNRKIDKFKELDSQSGMLKAMLEPTDNFDLVYTLDFADRDNTVAFGQPEQLNADGELPKPKRLGEGAVSGAGYDRSETIGHSLIATLDVNDSLLLKSITAHRAMKFDDASDYDGYIETPGVAPPLTALSFETERHVDQKQLSQELQIVGTMDTINFVSGLFYFFDEVDIANPYKDFNGVIPNFYGVEGTSYAVFGQMDWLATDNLTLTVGGRYTKEEKEAYVDHPRDRVVAYLDENFQPQTTVVAAHSSEGNEESWNNFSPMFVASYAFGDDTTVYAKYSEGWRSGGFNGEAATPEEAEKPYKEEITTAYEIGFKMQTFDNRLKINSSFFRNKIKDMQLSSYDRVTGYSQIENAGEAVITGQEIEALLAVTDDLIVFMNYGLLVTKYNNYIDPVSGVQLKDEATFAYAPDTKFAMGFDYIHSLGFADLKIVGDYSYTAEQVFYRQAYSSLVTKSEDYALLNGRIALVDIAAGGESTLDVGLWGKNLTGEPYRVNGIPGFGSANNAGDGINYYGDPRTFGLDVAYTF